MPRTIEMDACCLCVGSNIAKMLFEPVFKSVFCLTNILVIRESLLLFQGSPICFSTSKFAEYLFQRSTFIPGLFHLFQILDLGRGRRDDIFQASDWPAVTFPVISLVADVNSPTPRSDATRCFVTF